MFGNDSRKFAGNQLRCQQMFPRNIFLIVDGYWRIRRQFKPCVRHTIQLHLKEMVYVAISNYSTRHTQKG
jgi:hypothetical protein